jgi:RES domain-containing protein
MIVYRICNEQYSLDLSGNGARKFGGRWNEIDIPMLYASEHISLAALEILVHNGYSKFIIEFDLVTIELPKTAKVMHVDEDMLGDNWKLDTSTTHAVGTSLIRSNFLACKVPSAVIPEEHNFLINPLHAEFDKVRIVNKRRFEFEQRLF